MKPLKHMQNVENYNQWIAEGNLSKDYIEPARVYTPDELAKTARKESAKLLKDKVKNKENLTKDEQATINEVVLDMLGV